MFNAGANKCKMSVRRQLVWALATKAATKPKDIRAEKPLEAILRCVCDRCIRTIAAEQLNKAPAAPRSFYSLRIQIVPCVGLERRSACIIMPPLPTGPVRVLCGSLFMQAGVVHCRKIVNRAAG